MRSEQIVAGRVNGVAPQAFPQLVKELAQTLAGARVVRLFPEEADGAPSGNARPLLAPDEREQRLLLGRQAEDPIRGGDRGAPEQP
ncbi:MAG: hypothetical protein LJF04_01770 [Gemmatimonadetes bacterium]|nr:hypothetical protein [Gemmatimonadota bacterium]